MKPKKDLTYYHDINFEWLASYLNEHLDVDLYKMRFQPIGIFSRNVNHDVQKIESINVDGKPTLSFKLNRDGIYDNLPHGLFHKSLSTKSMNDEKEEVIKSIKIENEKETSARSYFALFESELLRTNLVNRILAFDVEKRDFGYAFSQIKLLLPFDTSIFTKTELVRIMQMFPFVNNLVDDLIKKSTHVIEFIFDLKNQVNVFTRFTVLKVDAESTYNQLGQSNLGWDFCIGTEIESTVTVAKISVQGKPNEKTIQKLHLITEWLFPLYMDIEIESLVPNLNPLELGSDLTALGKIKLN
jgi:hypothetical protein